jgi:hemin uptake protein HemP
MSELTRPSTLTLRTSASLSGTPRNHTKEPAYAARSEVAPAKPKDVSSNSGSAERKVQSDALLQGRRQVSIMHNGETYQLRATRLGKLILTK